MLEPGGLLRNGYGGCVRWRTFDAGRVNARYVVVVGLSALDTRITERRLGVHGAQQREGTDAAWSAVYVVSGDGNA